MTYFIAPASLNSDLFEVQTVASESGNVGLLFFRNDSTTVLDREVNINSTQWFTLTLPCQTDLGQLKLVVY